MIWIFPHRPFFHHGCRPFSKITCFWGLSPWKRSDSFLFFFRIANFWNFGSIHFSNLPIDIILLLLHSIILLFSVWIAPNLYVSRPLPRQNKLFMFGILTWYSSTATSGGLKNVFVYTFWWIFQFLQVKDGRRFLLFPYFAQKFQLKCSQN